MFRDKCTEKNRIFIDAFPLFRNSFNFKEEPAYYRFFLKKLNICRCIWILEQTSVQLKSECLIYGSFWLSLLLNTALLSYLYLGKPPKAHKKLPFRQQSQKSNNFFMQSNAKHHYPCGTSNAFFWLLNFQLGHSRHVTTLVALWQKFS